MKTYTAEELKEILEKHKRWLYNHEGTQERANLSDANLIAANLIAADLRRANLYGADLSDADLSDANLSGLSGNLCHVKSIQTETYYITYTSKVIQIDCQIHTIEKWKNFDDETIKKMDSKALEWWKKWKPVLMQIIELAPCEETK